MAFYLSHRSLSRLEGVHPDLVAAVKRAIQITPVDFMVVEGVRSREACMVNYGKGRTTAECAAKGIPASFAQPHLGKVTWLRNPFGSKHTKQDDGYGHAVDLLPAPYDWKDVRNFDLVAKAMFAAAEEQGISLRWGADWDRDGKPHERGETDFPHFEL